PNQIPGPGAPALLSSAQSISMNPTFPSEDAFLKSPCAQLIVSGGRVAAANRAAGNLLIGSADLSSLDDMPLEGQFSNAEKALSLVNGSALLMLCSPREKGPVACSVTVTRLNETCSLWGLEPVWSDQIREEDPFPLEAAIEVASEGIICVTRSRLNLDGSLDYVVRAVNAGAAPFLD